MKGIDYDTAMHAQKCDVHILNLIHSCHVGFIHLLPRLLPIKNGEEDLIVLDDKLCMVFDDRISPMLAVFASSTVLETDLSYSPSQHWILLCMTAMVVERPQQTVMSPETSITI